MKIAIIGGSHGGYAAAADLSNQGHEIALWRRDANAFGPVLAESTLHMQDASGTAQVRIATCTTDIAAAITDAELIVIPLPAFAQASVADQLAPHLSDGQVIFLPPGTFGSYAMLKRIRDAGQTARIAIAETGTLPYLARKHGPATIAITSRAVRLPTGVLPAVETEHALSVIGVAYPSVHPIEDALSGALMNAGPIIHPPLILMNAGPLQHFDTWDIHNEGTQPAVRSVTDRLDAERIAVREGLGYTSAHYPLSDHYTSDKWMYGDVHKDLTDSGDWREHIELTTHRYMTEDVAYGLAFLVSVARWAGVDAPVAGGLLAMGESICGNEFCNGSRTLDSLGLSALDRDGMATLLKNGI